MTFNFKHQKGAGLENQLRGFRLTKECMDLMKSLLTYHPKDRITSEEALKHPYFKEYNDVSINLNEFQLSSVYYINVKSFSMFLVKKIF